MPVNHGPPEQCCREEYEQWKWGTTTRYYASHPKTTLPTRKSVPRFSRQSDSDHRKETQSEVVWKCLPFIKFGQNHLARHSERGEKTRQTEKKAWKTTSGNGQTWSSPSPRWQWKTEKWRKLVVESSVSQRPLKLRDKWSEVKYISISRTLRLRPERPHPPSHATPTLPSPNLRTLLITQIIYKEKQSEKQYTSKA